MYTSIKMSAAIHKAPVGTQARANGRPLRTWGLALCGVVLLSACQTIPYDQNAATALEQYGADADRHILAVASAWKACQETVPPTSMEACTDGKYASYADTFYDDWESKLYTTQQQAAAGDVLGICGKAGELAAEFALTVADEALKTGLSGLDFADGHSCSLGSVGGVLQQHRNLRGYHEEFVVIGKDEVEDLRQTIAQSVRLALTVENFKKSVTGTPGN